MKRITPCIAISAAISSLGFAGDFQKPISNNESDFFAPFTHVHASKIGTPYVHSFGIEPAFTGRDLFIDHTFLNGQGFTEHESEIELEWAFTKRLGVIVEIPYIYEDIEGVGSAKGFGDIAIVPRVLLIERERFLLTAQVETVLPTGGSNFGGDTAIAPGIAMWNDLGNNFTLNSIVSIEHGFDADETELVYGVGLVKSFGGEHNDHTRDMCHEHAHESSSTAGMLHLHFEVTGHTPINGPDDGDVNLEGLFGISYGVIENLDIRAGYLFPLTNPNAFDHGITTGLIFHF
ncbi:MAG: hypothetical protein V4727_11950 [Verrucomicrobiota bacterium]